MKYVFHLRMTWLQCKFSKFVKGDKTIADITAYIQIQVNILCNALLSDLEALIFM